ncbi:MAG TPA: tetratricopeptide repeat protein, partial [Bacteroidales bacterium]|nr:tetratricopeptide repeat protein [Bacteroidales bacterium]
MKPKRFYFCIILFLLSPASLLSQDNEWKQKKIVSLINDADGYFIYDANYKAAAEIYKEILDKIPGDHNTSYKLGVCYLNITGKHHQALKLLEYACENYVEDHEYSTIGRSAPFDVLYYMGFACQVNMKLEKAIEYYKKYQNLLRVKDAAEIEYINLQIKACRNTIRAADTNTGLEKVLFAAWLKDFKNVIKPVLSD